MRLWRRNALFSANPTVSDMLSAALADVSRPQQLLPRRPNRGHALRDDEPQNGRHHLMQWHRCANLVTGNPAQQRLNGLQVVKEAA
jgi:hypothetical protein